MIKAIWTDNEEWSTRIDPRVAKATGQTELADAIGEGLAARRAGDRPAATAKLGRAVALAHASGQEETAQLLAGVVDVVDPVTGTVQLKPKVRDVDEMTLDVESTKTVRVKG
jgi:von Willebrand factor type A C-terminal domain